MRKDGEYGTEVKIDRFCHLCQIRNTCHVKFWNEDKK